MGNSQGTSVVYNILAFQFAGQKGAQETVEDIRSSGLLEGYNILSQSIVEQDAQGKVSIHETGRGGLGAGVGAVAGGLLGLIGGPAGLLAWAIGGAVIGGVAGKYLGRAIPKGDLQQIGQALKPDTSVLLMLLEDKDCEGVIKGMQGYSANVVTLTVGDELSGELAQFVAGEVGVSDDDDDGDDD